MLVVLTVNVTNLIVISVISLIAIIVIIHLIRVYKNNPCGDCASAKQCQAFSKKKILKAYKKECRLEKKNMDS